MPEFERGGWRLFYEDRGEGPPVLLIHSVLMDHTIFEPQVEALAGSYRLITPDLRGHGRSEHRAEERTLWDLMEDQVALLDTLGIERAVWGGVSIAGPVSLRAAIRYPDRVTGLLLMSTQAGREHPKRFSIFKAFADGVATQGWTEEFLHGLASFFFGKSAPEELRNQWIQRWRAQPIDDIREVIRAVIERESLLERLTEVRVSSLVVYGDEDGLALELDEVEQLVRALPHLFEFVRIPDAGHSPTVEQPEAASAAMSRFLDSIFV